MILHINAFGTLRLDGVAGDFVVDEDVRRRGLRMDKVLRKPAAICAVWNAAAYSASPIDAMTFLITELYTMIGPLISVGSELPR
jgi:hypothetical protein